MVNRRTRAALGAATLLATLALSAAATDAPSSPRPSPAVGARAVDLACMQAAVEKRDNAIIAAFDTFSVTVKSALTTRRDALKAAWGITDRAQRRAALRSAWSAFHVARRTAFRTFRSARHSAWVRFRADARACRGTPAGEEPASEGSDLAL